MQKKCLAASLLFHGALLCMVLFGSAFFTSREAPDNTPVLTFIPDMATDTEFVGGGSRAAAAPAPLPAPEPVPPAPALAPANREPVRAPEPEPVRTEDVTPVDQPVKPKFELPKSALKPVTRPSATKPAPNTSRTEVDSQARAQAAAEARRRQAALSSSLGRLSSSLSGSTEVAMPGTGSGGPSYAPYAAIIKKIYDDAWVEPDDLKDNRAAADVEIVVARDGTVISARIIRPSGNTQMDRSVQETVNRVKRIIEFPSTWKEQTKTFQIHFDLKSKEQILG